MKIENAQITWLDSGLPYSSLFDDVYYSRDDELEESLHVFLKANNLSQRWQRESGCESFHLGELGFGSGLNFLQTMKLWQELSERPTRLHYIAFEKYPLATDQLRRIHKRWPCLATQSAELLAQYTDHAEGCHRLLLSSGITLDLYFGDAQQQLQQRAQEICPAIQCWFLDGFSPASNSELWTESLMGLVAASSDTSTTLSTYSVAGKVRSALKSAGFEVSKIPGFGSKRHSLLATLPAIERESGVSELAADSMARVTQTPWFTLPIPHFKEKKAVIIGAGLAGCSTAFSLAQRGWQVTVADAASTPAGGASGNAQMALRCRLYNAASPEAEFFLQAYLFALRQFTQLAQRGELAWNPCGVLQLANAMNKRSPLQATKTQALYSEQLVRHLSCEQASSAAGLALLEEGLFFASGGAMDPRSLCESYLAHPNIECAYNTRVEKLERSIDDWVVHVEASPTMRADIVVIANSHQAAQLSQCADLPLQALRGQTSEIAASAASEPLSTVVSGERTVFPVHNGHHLISASYANSTDMTPMPVDSIENIALACSNFSDDAILNRDSVRERVSVRCNAPDRMPIVGMAPNFEKMRALYADLARNAKAKFTESGEYYTGLYLNVAHGSNGLASCPLSAEYLASLVARENLPLNAGIAASLNPVRFLISDLRKQR